MCVVFFSECLKFFLTTGKQILFILLATRNGCVIGFQGVSAEAAVIADFEAHDEEEDDHMRSFYWPVVSQNTSFGSIGTLFITLC